jgi:beta-lactamase regulating signal transducer with metallopeptidase domain
MQGYLSVAAESWYRWVLSSGLQATLLSIAVLFLVRAGRRWNPALRHALLMVALLKFIIPPTLNAPVGLFSQVHLAPPFSAPEPYVSRPGIARTRGVSRVSAPRQTDSGEASATNASQPQAPTVDTSFSASARPAEPSFPGDFNDVKLLLMLLHIAGGLVVLGLFARKLLFLRSLLAAAAPADGNVSLLYASLLKDFPPRRKPELLVGRNNGTPMAFGVIRPVILLPRRLIESLDPVELTTVLAHELAHHRRRDVVLRWFELPVSALWWFNPVYWVLSRQLRSAREDCCDDLVVASGLTGSPAYCETLLRAARLVSEPGSPGPEFAYIGESGALERRFRRLMDRRDILPPKLPAGAAIMVVLAGVLVLPGIGPVLTSNRPTCPCEPSAEVRVALQALPAEPDFSVGRDERMRPLRELAARFPRDIFVHSRLQESFWNNNYLYPEFEQAFASYRNSPDDPVFRYLDARLTGALDPVRSQEKLGRLLDAEPGFAWAHYEIARQSGTANDRQKTEKHLRLFLESCPDSLEGYLLLESVDDPAMLRDSAKKFRRVLESRRDASTIRYWPSLWDAEFRVAPEGDRASVLENVRRDLALLQSIPGEFTWDRYGVFRRGYQLTRDKELFAWAQRNLADRRRSGADDPEHPIFASWPPDEKLPLDRKLAMVDRALAFQAMSPDYMGQSDPPFFIHVAQLYVSWNVRLDQVPGLVQRDLAAAAYLDSSWVPAGLEGIRNSADLILASAYLAQRKLRLARDVIERRISLLPGNSGNFLWEWGPLQVRLAELEGDSARAQLLSLKLGEGRSGIIPGQPRHRTPFPDFEAKDRSGRIWRSSDLRGKTTLIDVWSADRGPSLAYQGELQGLYDRIKDRSDVQLLTFNIDANPYPAERHLAENSYKFPVIMSRTEAISLFGSLPDRTFRIVGPDGRFTMARCRKFESCISVELERAALENRR